MNPDELSLLNEVGQAAPADTSSGGLEIPLPINPSSCIAAASYRLGAGILTVVFQNGAAAHYRSNVVTAIGLIRADSPGSFFNSNIKGAAPPRRR